MGKKSKKETQQAETEFAIKPTSDGAKVDTSEWPLLLKVR